MKLKAYFLSLAAAILSLGTYAQSFEGKIIYQNTYKSKMANIPDEQFSSMMGSVQEFLIKGGNYKSTMNGTFLQWQLYINKDNKLYTRMAGSDAIFFQDGTVNADEIIKTDINKNVVTILDYACDELILTTKAGSLKFYYTSQIKMDPALFRNHKFGHWSEVIERINSLPLKMIIDNAQFTLESVAVSVAEQKLDDAIFTLPPDAKVQKSPF